MGATARRRDISGLGASMLSSNSGLAHLLRCLFRTKTERERMRDMRPPTPPKEYKVDVK